MRKTLVLVRHAKAKRPSDDLPDFDRQLSEAGKRSMRATLPHALCMWPESDGRTEIWSSPAARADQTASLLERALKRKGVKVSGGVQHLDALWTANEQLIVEELRTTEADVIALVGHNPFIEDWTRKITGSAIDFATGAIACVSVETEALRFLPSTLSTDEECPHRLLWFVQGPISQRWKTLVSMEQVIGDCVDKMNARLDAFYEDPEDIETMHKFRVSIRTLRSVIAFVKPWQDAAQNTKANAGLRDIVGVTSRLRELDVFAEQAQDNPSCSEELLNFCIEQANSERARVMKTLNSKPVRKKLERVSDELRSISWRKRYCIEGLDASAVRDRFDEIAESLRNDLESLDFSEVEHTHDVRKRAKRVRYSAEQFKGILGDDAPQIAKDMQSHQDDLGAICDARVNIDMINDFTDQPLPEPVAWDLALLRAQNETFLYTTLKDSSNRQ